MSTPDPILNAIARLEDRVVERLDLHLRELMLELDVRLDALCARLDRFVENCQLRRGDR